VFGAIQNAHMAAGACRVHAAPTSTSCLGCAAGINEWQVCLHRRAGPAPCTPPIRTSSYPGGGTPGSVRPPRLCPKLAWQRPEGRPPANLRRPRRRTHVARTPVDAHKPSNIAGLPAAGPLTCSRRSGTLCPGGGRSRIRTWVALATDLQTDRGNGLDQGRSDRVRTLVAHGLHGASAIAAASR
jgi:hypothetical protein